MYDKWEYESVRRRRKLANLLTRKPRQCDDGPVERFTNKDYLFPSSYACYYHVQIGIIETYRVVARARW